MQFEASTIPLPPLAEQRRIVARIEALAARIEEARRLRAQLTEECTALVTSVHLGLSGGRTIHLDEILALEEERAEVRIGHSYPQVGVKGFGQGLFPKEAVEAGQTQYRAFNRLYAGAIVLSQVKGWEGAIGVCPAELAGRYVSPEYRTFRCIQDRALPEYMAALVVTPWFWGQLKNATRGMGGRRERTRPEQFLQMQIPMPAPERQRKAVQMFNKLHQLRPLHNEAATELNALLPAILHRAFKGDLA